MRSRSLNHVACRWGLLLALVLTSRGLHAQTHSSADVATASVESTAPEKVATDLQPEVSPPGAAVGTWEAVRRHIHKGGRVVGVLLVLSVVAVTFALERLFNLRARRVVPDGLGEKADALWKQGRFDDLRQLCKRDRSILADMILTIVDHRDIDIAHIQTFAHDLGGRELRLELRRAYPLAVIATLAPLLGLLGTVVGMIGAFETVAFAGSVGDPSLLADDISKALITTQDGLVVAIPSLALYHYFRSQTNYFSVLLEDQASELISRWFMQKKA